MENTNPFEGFPFFGDFEKLFGNMGQDHWGTARQIAIQMAAGDNTDPNVDPSHRIEIEQLSRIAQLHVHDATGLDLGIVSLEATTRTQWVNSALEAYQPLFLELTEALTDKPSNDVAEGDPMSAMFGQLMQFLGPMMLAMTAGSMVGHLAQRSLGQYDLPIPRDSKNEIQIITHNVGTFGEEWSLPSQELFLWVCLHELCHHAVLRIEHVHERLHNLLINYVSGFESNPTGLEEKLGQIDMNSPSALHDLQSSLGDPEIMLGVIQSDAQLAILPELHALIAVVVGYVDHVMDEMGVGLISSYSQVTEALRRRRVEENPSDRFIERIFGLELTQSQYERGGSFVAGVIERAGKPGLSRLWQHKRNLPTPNEVDAPGLWLARIDLPEEDL
ncbi:MAG: zinc-dependent metalloprotease [Acidimicrobiales bacterium]|nr:zinc-dependent metalloprotease [Acidimicrobiales bacterium]